MSKVYLNLPKYLYKDEDSKLELVPVTELLKFREFNRLIEGKYSKEQSFDNIKKLEEVFKSEGITSPLIIEYSVEDNAVLLIEGNHRLNVALELGIRYLPARVVRRNSSFPNIQKAKSMKVSGFEPNQYGYVPADLKPSQVGIQGTKPINNGDESVYLYGGEVILAPNGKPSNLNPEQYKLVRTKAFKDWFGDWENSPETASKVVDENGEPMVCYHGTGGLFNKFDDNEKGSRGGLNEKFWSFTSNIELAKIYALGDRRYSTFSEPRVISAFLNIKEMPTYDNEGRLYRELKVWGGYKYIDIFQLQDWHDRGFDMGVEFKKVDGFCVKNTIEMEDINKNAELSELIGDTYYVRNSNQIKLADGTNTTFDANNPDIRFNDGGEVLLAPNGKPSNLTPEQYKLVRTTEFKAWFGDWENDPENASKVVDENGEPMVVWHYAKRLQYYLDKFYVFRVDKQLGSHFGTLKQSQNLKYIPLGESEVVTSNKELNDFRYYQVFLNIKKPIRLIDVGIFEFDTLINGIGSENLKDYDWEYINDYNKKIKGTILDRAKWIAKSKFGYDGGVYLNRYESDATTSYVASLDGVSDNKFKKLIPSAEDSWIAFYPNQIKLADGTNTTFDANNPDIRYSEGGLIAPNGKKSNLTPEQYKLVRTPEFKTWFGDWENSPETASKMLDDNGEPLVCYHGTNRDFTVFRSDVGSAHDLGFYGRGFYFTFNPDSKWMKYAKGEAGYYGSIVKDYFIKTLNPFDFSSLSEYKGVGISYIGTESIVFLNNIALKYPELSEIIKVQQVKWNKETQENDVDYVPISVLPELIEKYSKLLKTFETEDNFGEKNKISGYVKSELVEYDYTSSGGTKGSYTSIDTLGTYDNRLKKEEVEILLVVDAIEKYERIEARYQPEGYMTRYPEITDLIKKDHDGIIQTKFGDEVVVFEPTQIKLADGTNVTFDSNNPDVRFNDGGSLENITETENFKKWFGNSVFVENKSVWDEDKYLTVKNPKIFYHETLSDNLKKIEEDGFNISLASSRKGDNLMPDGIFLKDNDKEIGVGGKGDKVQIPVYVSAEKVKYFENRNDLYNYIKDNKNFYDKYWESEMYDKDMNRKFEEQFKYNKYFEGYERGTGEYKQRLDLYRSETDKFLDEWKSENDRLAAESRKNVTDILKSEDLDAIVVRNDEGSFGRRVYTLVVFNPNSIKSAVNNIGTFDKNKSGIIYNDGGGVSFDKLMSASSRFKPTETVVFEPPLEGKNGAKLISYTWSYEWTITPNYEGELKSKRVSDWSQAEISADTGRDIVHQYTVLMPDGEYKTVSSDSVPILLGYIDRKELKSFPNLVTASKTLAKQQMQLAILEAQKKEYDELHAKFEKAEKPEITLAEITELPLFTQKIYNRELEEGKGISFTYFKMGDVFYRQDNQYKYNEGKYIASTKPDNRTIEQLTWEWVAKRVEEAGGVNPRGLYDLKNRVERQKRKVEQMLKTSKMELGGNLENSDLIEITLNRVYSGEINSDDAAIELDESGIEVDHDLYEKLRYAEKRFLNKNRGLQVGDTITVKGKHGNSDFKGNFRGFTNEGKLVVVYRGGNQMVIGKDDYYENGGNLEDFDWESLFNPSPEEQERINQEIKKSEEQEKEDWYQSTKFSKKWAATYQDAVNRTVKEYLDAKATYDDWASRQYKQNKGMVFLGGDDVFGEAKSIGSINEGRRQRVLRGAKMQMDEAVETLKELRLTDEQISNLLDNKIKNGGSIDDKIISARKMQLRNKLANILKTLDYKTVDVHSGKSKEDLFIQRIVDMIYGGYDFKSKLDIERVATKEFGFDDAKKVRELTEYAILFVGRDISKEGDVKDVYEKLVSLYANQPYSTNRTVKSQELGQFSTPAPMAYLMGVYVGINKNQDNKIYFEPTAGNGMLSIAGNPQDFVVNELDFNRYNNLLKDNYKLVLNQDATKPFNFDYKFDGLLANPPFATTKIDKIVDNFKISGLENQIMINSLDLLKDNARGAFIVGGHTEFDSAGRIKSAKDKSFLSYLYSRYNVEDVINVSGTLYGRQGTTYPIRIILFNGRKSIPSGYYPLKNDKSTMFEPFSHRVINNFDELYERFKKTLLINQ